jgi:DNA-binding IscR family transcriptional regulator
VKACTIRLTMARVRDAMSEVLDRLSIADMAAMGDGSNVALMYHI